MKAYQQSLTMQQKLQDSEQLKNVHRNLKIQFNITQDENVRLRTRLQALASDLQRKEKDMEGMLRQLQGDKTNSKTNYLESFLVQQLKK